MGGARGSASPANVPITDSAEGDMAIEPDPRLVIDRWCHARALLRPVGPYSTRGADPSLVRVSSRAG